MSVIFGDTTPSSTPSVSPADAQYEFGSNVRITPTVSQPVLGENRAKPFYSPSSDGLDAKFFVMFQSVDGLPAKLPPPKDDVLGARTLDVIKVSKREEKAVKEGLVEMTAQLRSMLVEDFAPFALSIDQAWDESTSVLKMITPDENLEIESGGIKQIMTTALKILMVNKTSELLGLGERDRALLVDLTLVRHHKPHSDTSPTQATPYVQNT